MRACAHAYREPVDVCVDYYAGMDLNSAIARLLFSFFLLSADWHVVAVTGKKAGLAPNWGAELAAVAAIAIDGPSPRVVYIRFLLYHMLCVGGIVILLCSGSQNKMTG